MNILHYLGVFVLGFVWGEVHLKIAIAKGEGLRFSYVIILAEGGKVLIPHPFLNPPPPPLGRNRRSVP